MGQVRSDRGGDVEQNYGYWRVTDGSTVAVARADALTSWTEAAYPVLVGVAGSYRAVITYGELAAEVQAASGVRTKALQHNWIGRVLGGVVHEAHRRGDPPLTALVVHAQDGMVGEGYKEVLEVAGEPPAGDELARELHAARARLACYREFCQSLPADGGTAALAPRYESTVARRRAAAAAEKPAAVCPGCSLQLPATGACDFC
ncbi:hypothetical protein [Kitasatospora sp. NPDC057015]|uniref:hypothetical protein n=1 Tax=Kitasatospora sp. NPDC057015 TaxID=3346001 RepID=UPI00363CA0CD